jgi:hypothetical protein
MQCLFGHACPVHDTGSAEQTVSVRLRESVAKFGCGFRNFETFDSRALFFLSGMPYDELVG